MKTSRTVGGSRIVIWKNDEHYVDVRRGYGDRYDQLECVRNGQVYRREVIYGDNPERVVEIVREELRKARKMKTSELTGPALNWAVCWAVYGVAPVKSTHPELSGWRDSNIGYRVKPYSTSWKHGGSIIDRERIGVYPSEAREGEWAARNLTLAHIYGPTPLIAAMRCYVTSKLGDEVEIPEELL